MWDEIVKADVVIECIGPEVRLEVGTGKHSAEGVADCLVRSLTRSILVRRIWSGEFDRVTEIYKGAVDVSAFTEFASAIHANIFVGTLRSIAGKPTIDPVNGWGLCREGSSKDSAAEVVGQ